MSVAAWVYSPVAIVKYLHELSDKQNGCVVETLQNAQLGHRKGCSPFTEKVIVSKDKE